jgi:hypothetical protein
VSSRRDIRLQLLDIHGQTPEFRRVAMVASVSERHVDGRWHVIMLMPVAEGARLSAEAIGFSPRATPSIARTPPGISRGRRPVQAQQARADDELQGCQQRSDRDDKLRRRGGFRRDQEEDHPPDEIKRCSTKQRDQCGLAKTKTKSEKISKKVTRRESCVTAGSPCRERPRTGCRSIQALHESHPDIQRPHPGF